MKTIDVNLKQLEIAHDEMNVLQSRLRQETDRLEMVRHRLPEVLRDEETDILMRRLSRIRDELLEESWKMRQMQQGLNQVYVMYHQTENRVVETAQADDQNHVVPALVYIDMTDFKRMQAFQTLLL